MGLVHCWTRPNTIYIPCKLTKKPQTSLSKPRRSERTYTAHLIAQQSTMDNAVSRGDLERVRQHIRMGVDVNELTRGGDTLLQLAIQIGYKDIALALLKSGADVRAKDAKGWTALHWACCKGFKEVVQMLINKGSEVDERDHFGATPLMLERQDNEISMCLLRAGASCVGLQQSRVDELFDHACHEGDMFAVRALGQDGCRVSILSRKEQEGLLHHACREGDVFVVHALHQDGCRVSILSRKEQEVLLHHACREGDVFVVHALLQDGCRVSILSRAEQEVLLRHAYHERDVFVVHALFQVGCRVSILSRKEQEVLLHHAYREGDVFVVHALFQVGCRVSILSRKEQEVLLHHACRKGDVFVVHALFQDGCRVSILSREEQEGLLHHAYHERDVFVVHALFQDGCRVSILSRKEQEVLLLHAYREGDVFVVHALFQVGCRVSILSRKEQEVLLHHAYREGDVFVVHALFQDGCRVSILSREEQEGLLHHAYHERDVFVVHALFQDGCRVSILSRKEQEGLLHHACREGDVFVVHALHQDGCRVSILSRKEQEVLLHHACREGDVFVVHALFQDGCRVSILSRKEQEVLLHHACREGDVFVVHALFQVGCRVSILSREEQEVLLHHAYHERDVFVVHALFQVGCRVSILSREEQEVLLHHAYHERDVFVVHALFQDGCRVSILAREEQEGLLHHACREGDVFVVHTLLKNGCRVSILSREEQEGLLHHAYHERDVFVVHALFQDGCRVSILSREEQEGLLHHACHEGDMFVVRALHQDGCRVSILSREEQEVLLHHACREGDVFVVHALFQDGCRVSILSREEQEGLLHHACREGDVFVVHALHQDGCRVSILSREEQEGLLHHACHEGDVFVVHALFQDGCRFSILSREEQEGLLHHAYHEGDMFVVHALFQVGCRVSILSREEQEGLLHHACRESDVFVVDALLGSGCNINCVDFDGLTPLMVATKDDNEELVKKLMLAGANLAMRTASGNTALHSAATHNNIQCGVLLVEGGASVRTKNKLSQIPLQLATAEFKKAIKEALSFTTRKALCIIGNAESGKSTLIAALQAESNSFLGKIINRFRRVDDLRQRTAGIETVPHFSQRYGEVLFFDFAGQDDYHGPHQMFLESLLSKPGVSMTLLLVVKMTEEEEAILHQLHRWLTPVALMATTSSPPNVIIIGSFLDKVKFKEEATAKLTRCIEATRSDLKEFSLDFIGSSFLNCRQPQSVGIDKICAFLQEIPIPEFGASQTHYSLAWVLSQIRSSITAQAVQLKEFSKWIQDNKDNLPQTMPSPAEVCQDLSAAGHALYLPNRECPPSSWLVLDLTSILHDVYGTLFSQYRKIVSKFGLLQIHHLAELFPHLDLEMVQQLLVSLEFCLPVDPSLLKLELSKLTQSEETSGWLFFPALISAKPPQFTLKAHLQPSVRYLCWQLKTSKKHSISARLLQTILLRLAAHFVVKQHNEEGVQQHCCSIWCNGIEWQSSKGIDITIHIIHNRVIQVMGASEVSPDKSCQYLTDVISDILSTVQQLSPNLAAKAYIVHPPRTVTSIEDVIAPPPKELFPVAEIRSSYKDGFSLSLLDSNSNRCERVEIIDLFGRHIPSLNNIERINWTCGQPQSSVQPSQPDVLSQAVHSECLSFLLYYDFYDMARSMLPLYIPITHCSSVTSCTVQHFSTYMPVTLSN